MADDLKQYLQYYDLEGYLDTVVRPFFESERHKYLTVEHLFLIIAWKNPKFGIRKVPQLNDEEAVRALTNSIVTAPTHEHRLHTLLFDEKNHSRRGLKLATASAILTVLYPEDFTVYDIRVRKQLAKRGLWRWKDEREQIPLDISTCKDVVQKYFAEYLFAVKKVANEGGLSLRDCDRALWAKDWYEDMQQFIAEQRASVY